MFKRSIRGKASNGTAWLPNETAVISILMVFNSEFVLSQKSCSNWKYLCMPTETKQLAMLNQPQIESNPTSQLVVYEQIDAQLGNFVKRKAKENKKRNH